MASVSSDHCRRMTGAHDEGAPVVRLKDVALVFGKTRALDGVTLDVPKGRMVGLIGPDGVGKSSLLSLITGARVIQDGDVLVLSGDMRDRKHRLKACPDIAYMPQGLGKNLYPTLSVQENADFFARLFGLNEQERATRIAQLLKSTGLDGFEQRPAGKLSGGMKQKLGLICSLIHDPELLVLDEPTTGVDPLARRQFWDLIDEIREDRPSMSVIVATAYMEEAQRFDWLIAMDDGKVLATGTPQELLDKTQTDNLDSAFIELMPDEKRATHHAVHIPPRNEEDNDEIAIEADGLTMRFGDFTAVDHVSFRIGKGEIFGFLGSNGCGKTTTMKMLTGLLKASEGTAKLFGQPVRAGDIETRRHVGYMSQAFSLYSELTVRENLALHTRLFQMDADTAASRMKAMIDRFDLESVADTLPDALPLGIRQRLSLAVALIHSPEMLILDEPTSGVDPIARDQLWETLGELARNDGVTIFISTHFMNEAERCDRISLMHAGKVLVSDTPKAITESKQADTLEDAFIAYLQDAIDENEAAEFGTRKGGEQPETPTSEPADKASKSHGTEGWRQVFSPQRMLSFAHRETLELRRDPIRATLALLGSIILMLVIGYGVNMDVENLSFAVLDHDRTNLSRDYIAEISGSRYFIEHDPVKTYDEIDQRMRSGELSLVIEIPPRFAEDVARGRPVSIGAWIDGAMPQRAETVRGYVQGMHAGWLKREATIMYGDAAMVGTYQLEIRYRYNPAVESLPAMVPAVIPLLLLMIPSMLAALSVVREKEMGSIINLYVTPTTRFEFLLGKQIPYVALGFLNCILLWLVAVFLFRVEFTGGLLTFMVAGLLYVMFATAFGLLISAFMSSQIAAIFGVAILTLLPASQFSGLIDPVSSLEGAGAFIGRIYPTTYFMTISRGTFSKALDFFDLLPTFVPLLIAPVILMLLATVLLRKQAR